MNKRIFTHIIRKVPSFTIVDFHKFYNEEFGLVKRSLRRNPISNNAVGALVALMQGLGFEVAFDDQFGKGAGAQFLADAAKLLASDWERVARHYEVDGNFSKLLDQFKTLIIEYAPQCNGVDGAAHYPKPMMVQSPVTHEGLKRPQFACRVCGQTMSINKAADYMSMNLQQPFPAVPPTPIAQLIYTWCEKNNLPRFEYLGLPSNKEQELLDVGDILSAEQYSVSVPEIYVESPEADDTSWLEEKMFYSDAQAEWEDRKTIDLSRVLRRNPGEDDDDLDFDPDDEDDIFGMDVDDDEDEEDLPPELMGDFEDGSDELEDLIDEITTEEDADNEALAAEIAVTGIPGTVDEKDEFEEDADNPTLLTEDAIQELKAEATEAAKDTGEEEEIPDVDLDDEDEDEDEDLDSSEDEDDEDDDDEEDDDFLFEEEELAGDFLKTIIKQGGFHKIGDTENLTWGFQDESNLAKAHKKETIKYSSIAISENQIPLVTYNDDGTDCYTNGDYTTWPITSGDGCTRDQYRGMKVVDGEEQLSGEFRIRSKAIQDSLVVSLDREPLKDKSLGAIDVQQGHIEYHTQYKCEYHGEVPDPIGNGDPQCPQCPIGDTQNIIPNDKAGKPIIQKITRFDPLTDSWGISEEYTAAPRGLSPQSQFEWQDMALRRWKEADNGWCKFKKVSAARYPTLPEIKKAILNSAEAQAQNLKTSDAEFFLHPTKAGQLIRPKNMGGDRPAPYNGIITACTGAGKTKFIIKAIDMLLKDKDKKYGKGKENITISIIVPSNTTLQLQWFCELQNHGLPDVLEWDAEDIQLFGGNYSAKKDEKRRKINLYVVNTAIQQDKKGKKEGEKTFANTTLLRHLYGTWSCQPCGLQDISGSVEDCPQCGTSIQEAGDIINLSTEERGPAEISGAQLGPDDKHFLIGDEMHKYNPGAKEFSKIIEAPIHYCLLVTGTQQIGAFQEVYCKDCDKIGRIISPWSTNTRESGFEVKGPGKKKDGATIVYCASQIKQPHKKKGFQYINETHKVSVLMMSTFINYYQRHAGPNLAFYSYPQALWKKNIAPFRLWFIHCPYSTKESAAQMVYAKGKEAGVTAPALLNAQLAYQKQVSVKRMHELARICQFIFDYTEDDGDRLKIITFNRLTDILKIMHRYLIDQIDKLEKLDAKSFGTKKETKAVEKIGAYHEKLAAYYGKPGDFVLQKLAFRKANEWADNASLMEVGKTETRFITVPAVNLWAKLETPCVGSATAKQIVKPQVDAWAAGGRKGSKPKYRDFVTSHVVVSLDDFRNGATSQDRVFPLMQESKNTQGIKANSSLGVKVIGKKLIVKNARIAPRSGYNGRMRGRGIAVFQIKPIFSTEEIEAGKSNPWKKGKIGVHYAWAYIDTDDASYEYSAIPNPDGPFDLVPTDGSSKKATKVDVYETFIMDRVPVDGAGNPIDFTPNPDSPNDGHIFYIRNIPSNDPEGAQDWHLPKALESKKSKQHHSINWAIPISAAIQRAIRKKHLTQAKQKIISFVDPVTKQLIEDVRVGKFLLAASAKGKDIKYQAGVVIKQLSVDKKKPLNHFVNIYKKVDALTSVYEKALEAAAAEIAAESSEKPQSYDAIVRAIAGRDASDDCPNCGTPRDGCGDDETIVFCSGCDLEQSIFTPFYRLEFKWQTPDYDISGKMVKTGKYRSMTTQSFPVGHNVYITQNHDISHKVLKEAYMEEYRIPVGKVEQGKFTGSVQCMLSGKALVEGIDVPDVDVGISISPASSNNPIPNLQALGRVLRLKRRINPITGEEELMPKDFIVLYAASNKALTDAERKSILNGTAAGFGKEANVLKLFRSELMLPSTNAEEEGGKWVCYGGRPFNIEHEDFFTQFRKFFDADKFIEGNGGEILFSDQPPKEDLSTGGMVAEDQYLGWVSSQDKKVILGFSSDDVTPEVSGRLKPGFRITLWPNRTFDPSNKVTLNIEGGLGSEWQNTKIKANKPLRVGSLPVPDPSSPGSMKTAVNTMKVIQQFNKSKDSTWQIEVDYYVDRLTLAKLVMEMLAPLSLASLAAVEPKKILEYEHEVAGLVSEIQAFIEEYNAGDFNEPLKKCEFCKGAISYTKENKKITNHMEKSAIYKEHVKDICEESPKVKLERLQARIDRVVNNATKPLRCWEEHNPRVIKRIKELPEIPADFKKEYLCEIQDLKKSGSMQIVSKLEEILAGIEATEEKTVSVGVWEPIWWKPLKDKACGTRQTPNSTEMSKVSISFQTALEWIKKQIIKLTKSKSIAKAFEKHFGIGANPFEYALTHSYIRNTETQEVRNINNEIIVPAEKDLLGKFVVKCGPQYEVTNTIENAKKAMKAMAKNPGFQGCNTCKIVSYVEKDGQIVGIEISEADSKGTPKKPKKTVSKVAEVETVDGIELSPEKYTLWADTTLTQPIPSLNDPNVQAGASTMIELYEIQAEYGQWKYKGGKLVSEGVPTFIGVNSGSMKVSSQDYTLWWDKEFTIPFFHPTPSKKRIKHVGFDYGDGSGLINTVRFVKKLWDDKLIHVYVKGLPGNWLFFKDHEYKDPWLFGSEEEPEAASAAATDMSPAEKKADIKESVLAIAQSGEFDLKVGNMYVYINPASVDPGKNKLGRWISAHDPMFKKFIKSLITPKKRRRRIR